MAQIKVPKPQWTSNADDSTWLAALRQKISEQPALVGLGAPVNRSEGVETVHYLLESSLSLLYFRIR